jgi:formylglycine-generating enzyme required for sulfatase activity
MQSFAIGCHIIRNGISGNYSYSVASGYENRPVNYVSYWSAARFTNWLQNGQGNGDTETGAYTLNGYKGWEGGNIVRNAGWEWAITSEDEWYKAAYYDPNMTGGTKYWLYPTSSNTAPGRDLTDVTGNNANSEGGLGPPYYTTIVGEFQNSASTYGTFDQGGNVWEWTESIYTRSNRLLRGGGLAAGTYALAASHREYNYQPSSANGYWGFRVVQAYVPQAVPEPATLLGFGIPMLMIGLGKLRGLRK